MAPIRVGTRASALARWQTEHIIALWRRRESGLEVAIVDLTTAGDELADAPLETMEGTGFFTSTLEHALLEGRIDVAIHSYKDLPVISTPGLVVTAVPERGPVEDALCARNGLTLAALPAGARVGTSSLRRTAQLRRLRADLDYRTLRGNVPTRVDRVARGDLDAVVLARAGLVRLALDRHVTQVFAPADVLPAPAQGALAVQIRAGEPALERRLAPLDHEPTHRAVTAERLVLHLLRGGCSVPVGTLATVAAGSVAIDAGVFAPDGGRAVRVQASDASPEAAGAEAGRRLIAGGAREILAALDRTPRVEVTP